jgi:uncharacterized protein YqeY
MSLKEQIQSDMKNALRAGEKQRLSVIRMLLAAIQTREIEARSDLPDQEILAVVEKLVKQGKDSAKQFADAGRPDREAAELSEAEIAALLDDVMAATGASSMQDMGKVMGQLKAKAQGRADMGTLSSLVKARLSA